MAGIYKSQLNKSWADFRAELAEKILAGMNGQTRRLTANALDHFERHVKPLKVHFLSTAHIDEFVAKRRLDRGKHRGETVSVATINKDLRHLRAALRYAVDWQYLSQMPRFKKLREPEDLPTYVTGDHFALLYDACETARRPGGLPYPASDWWRALLVMGYMTGWRIGDLLGLRREDLDLEAATAITRFADNKGKRSERVNIHPVVVEHVRKLAAFDPCVFPWDHDTTTLYTEFYLIQKAAGIHLSCPAQHEHTPKCHFYGFHDLRRAFATMNADKLSADALQKLMRHRSYLTTQKYINMSRQMAQAVASLHVPEVLRKDAK
jgi:integrase